MEIKNKEELFTYLSELETKLTTMQETLDSQSPKEEEKPDEEEKPNEEENSKKEIDELDDFFNDEK